MKIKEYPKATSLTETDVIVVETSAGTKYAELGQLSESKGLSWEDVYPIGAIYLSWNSTSPGSLFGGTWEPIIGRFLRANTDTNVGGSDTVTLTAAQSGLRSHSHSVNLKNTTGSGKAAMADPVACASVKATGGYITDVSSASATSSHTNLPLYQDVYAWRRTR